MLEDLEKVMPARVHLVSIHPELDEDNQLKLKMMVAGDSRDRAIELARRMEDSRRFTQTYIETETFQPFEQRRSVFSSVLLRSMFPSNAGTGRKGGEPSRKNGNLRAERALMPDLRQTRKNIKTALAVLIGVDVVAVVVLFSPLVGSTDSRRLELNQLWSELQTKTRQVEPLTNLSEESGHGAPADRGFLQEALPHAGFADSGSVGKARRPRTG